MLNGRARKRLRSEDQSSNDEASNATDDNPTPRPRRRTTSTIPASPSGRTRSRTAAEIVAARPSTVVRSRIPYPVAESSTGSTPPPAAGPSVSRPRERLSLGRKSLDPEEQHRRELKDAALLEECVGRVLEVYFEQLDDEIEVEWAEVTLKGNTNWKALETATPVMLALLPPPLPTGTPYLPIDTRMPAAATYSIRLANLACFVHAIGSKGSDEFFEDAWKGFLRNVATGSGDAPGRWNDGVMQIFIEISTQLFILKFQTQSNPLASRVEKEHVRKALLDEIFSYSLIDRLFTEDGVKVVDISDQVRQRWKSFVRARRQIIDEKPDSTLAKSFPYDIFRTETLNYCRALHTSIINERPGVFVGQEDTASELPTRSSMSASIAGSRLEQRARLSLASPASIGLGLGLGSQRRRIRLSEPPAPRSASMSRARLSDPIPHSRRFAGVPSLDRFHNRFYHQVVPDEHISEADDEGSEQRVHDSDDGSAADGHDSERQEDIDEAEHLTDSRMDDYSDDEWDIKDKEETETDPSVLQSDVALSERERSHPHQISSSTNEKSRMSLVGSLIGFVSSPFRRSVAPSPSQVLLEEGQRPIAYKPRSSLSLSKPRSPTSTTDIFSPVEPQSAIAPSRRRSSAHNAVTPTRQQQPDFLSSPDRPSPTPYKSSVQVRDEIEQNTRSTSLTPGRRRLSGSIQSRSPTAQASPRSRSSTSATPKPHPEPKKRKSGSRKRSSGLKIIEQASIFLLKEDVHPVEALEINDDDEIWGILEDPVIIARYMNVEAQPVEEDLGPLASVPLSDVPVMEQAPEEVAPMAEPPAEVEEVEPVSFKPSAKALGKRKALSEFPPDPSAADQEPASAPGTMDYEEDQQVPHVNSGVISHTHEKTGYRQPEMLTIPTGNPPNPKTAKALRRLSQQSKTPAPVFIDSSDSDTSSRTEGFDASKRVFRQQQRGAGETRSRVNGGKPAVYAEIKGKWSRRDEELLYEEAEKLAMKDLRGQSYTSPWAHILRQINSEHGGFEGKSLTNEDLKAKMGQIMESRYPAPELPPKHLMRYLPNRDYRRVNFNFWFDNIAAQVNNRQDGIASDHGNPISKEEFRRRRKERRARKEEEAKARQERKEAMIDEVKMFKGTSSLKDKAFKVPGNYRSPAAHEKRSLRSSGRLEAMEVDENL